MSYVTHCSELSGYLLPFQLFIAVWSTIKAMQCTVCSVFMLLVHVVWHTGHGVAATTCSHPVTHTTAGPPMEKVSCICAVAQYAVLEANGKVSGMGEISNPYPSQTLGPIWMPLQIYHYVRRCPPRESMCHIWLKSTQPLPLCTCVKKCMLVCFYSARNARIASAVSVSYTHLTLPTIYSV